MEVVPKCKAKAASTNMWATAENLYYFHTITWGPIELSLMDTTVYRDLSKYRHHQRMPLSSACTSTATTVAVGSIVCNMH